MGLRPWAPTGALKSYTQGVSKPMKWLPVAASFILVCAPSIRAATANKHQSHAHHSHNVNHRTKSHHAHHNAHHTSARSDDSSRQVARQAQPPDESPSLVAVRYARQTSSSAAPSSTAHHHHYKKKAHARGVQLPKGPSPDRISEIQSALARGGYYQGDSTGKWDDNTVAAMQKFQSANGIEATGKIDAPSLQKLGLGSDIAGVSAPRSPSPPVTTSTTPSSHSAVTASASSSSSVPLRPATETASASNAAAPAAPQAAAVAPAPAADPGSSTGSH
jgi:Putative peptidoglycan binding domain